MVELEHSIGYSSAVVSNGRDTIHHQVNDHDFVGHVVSKLRNSSGTSKYARAIGTITDGNVVTESSTGGQHHTYQTSKGEWNGKTSSAKDVEFAVIRSRSKWESQRPDQRAVGLMAVDVWVKVVVNNLDANEWSVKILRTEGDLSSEITSAVKFQ